MKLFHLSDLHLGKRLNEYSLLEDQRYILDQILTLVEREQPQAVLISGDVYDKATPSAEAVALFDYFLVELRQRGPQVFVISGNHDSPERLAFGGQLMAGSGVHLSPVYHGRVEPITLTDEFGPVHFYLLPFVKPATVRPFFAEEELVNYNDALRVALAAMAPDFTQRNVLLSHQFVTGAKVNSSGESTVGGLENVEAGVFRGFDYVALGHIHGPQTFEGDAIRYCGTPLHYSLNEVSGSKQTLSTGVVRMDAAEKSITVAELGQKGSLTLRTLPLCPLRPVVALQGSYDQIMHRDTYHSTNLQNCYVYVTLTDDKDISQAISNLRTVYPHLLGMRYRRSAAGNSRDLTFDRNLRPQSPLELFEALFRLQWGEEKPLLPEQQEYLGKLMVELEEAAL